MPANQCPACSTEVDPAACVCPSCKADLAQCSWCRAITTLRSPDSGGRTRLERTRFVCDRCGRPGVRCRTSFLGGYCNGLARAGGVFGRQFCARCTTSIMGLARNVASWTVIGFVGSRLRPRG